MVEFDESFVGALVCTLVCFGVACYCVYNVLFGDLSAGQFVVCLLSAGLFSACTLFAGFMTFYPVLSK